MLSLGGSEGGSGRQEHGLSMGRCVMELELGLIIALLPRLYSMYQVPGIPSFYPSNQPREVK